MRVNAGVSISQAIENLSISYSMLSKIECNNRTPGASVIPKMAKLYDCTTDEIFEAMKKNETLEKPQEKDDRDEIIE